MEIKEIQNNPIKPDDIKSYEPKKITKAKSEDKDIEKPSPSWQKEILMEGIDKLDDIVQMDNSHPLSSPSNAPIETFKEALAELDLLKNSNFEEEASKVQANLDIENVAGLFVEA